MTTSAIPQSLKKILLTSHTFLFNDKFDFTWGPQAIMFSQIRDSAEWQAERGPVIYGLKFESNNILRVSYVNASEAPIRCGKKIEIVRSRTHRT